MLTKYAVLAECSPFVLVGLNLSDRANIFSCTIEQNTFCLCFVLFIYLLFSSVLKKQNKKKLFTWSKTTATKKKKKKKIDN